jgi:hypothetical protein
MMNLYHQVGYLRNLMKKCNNANLLYFRNVPLSASFVFLCLFAYLMMFYRLLGLYNVDYEDYCK